MYIDGGLFIEPDVGGRKDLATKTWACIDKGFLTDQAINEEKNAL